MGHNGQQNAQLQVFTDDPNVVHLDGQIIQYWVHGKIKLSHENLLIPKQIIERAGRVYDKTLNNFCNDLSWILPMYRLIQNYYTSQNWIFGYRNAKPGPINRRKARIICKVSCSTNSRKLARNKTWQIQVSARADVGHTFLHDTTYQTVQKFP